MAAKKDFSQISTDAVYSSIQSATAEHGKRKPRKEYTEQEAQEIAETMRTSGRKGVKLPRINTAFQPSNYEYVQTMARVSGITLTEFINKAIKEHREAHADLYEQAIAFRDALDGNR